MEKESDPFKSPVDWCSPTAEDSGNRGKRVNKDFADASTKENEVCAARTGVSHNGWGMDFKVRCGLVPPETASDIIVPFGSNVDATSEIWWNLCRSPVQKSEVCRRFWKPRKGSPGLSKWFWNISCLHGRTAPCLVCPDSSWAIYQSSCVAIHETDVSWIATHEDGEGVRPI